MKRPFRSFLFFRFLYRKCFIILKTLTQGDETMNEYRKQLLENIDITTPEDELEYDDWDYISLKSNLSEIFIREFQDELVWESISRNEHLTKNSIREFKDEVDWNFISLNRNLTEDFIREFQELFNWIFVVRYQKMSDSFVIEFNEIIDFNDYFLFHDATFPIMKKFIFKTKYHELKQFKTTHLNEEQEQEIQRLLDLKYMFRK